MQHKWTIGSDGLFCTECEMLIDDLNITMTCPGKPHNIDVRAIRLEKELEATKRQLTNLQGQVDAGRMSPDYEHIKQLAILLTDHPEGCMCPNNGGGDCEWCQLADSIKAYK